MPIVTAILGLPQREGLVGSGISVLAPGYRGQLTQLDPASGGRAAGDPLPLATAAANADVVVVSQMTLDLRPPPPRAGGELGRGIEAAPPKLILARKPNVEYALLQTGEDGYSQWIFPAPNEKEAVFELAPSGASATTPDGRAAVTSAMRLVVRIVAWAAEPVLDAGALAIARKWESSKRPYAFRQVTSNGQFVETDWRVFESGPWLLLIHGTFSTPETAFTGWLGTPAFKAVMEQYGGRCLALAHPSLSAGPDDNVDWTLNQLPSATNGQVDVVCHSRGGLVTRRLTASDRLKIRRVCQVGTPNDGTPLAYPKHLITFLDGHTALLTKLPDTVSTILLEGILCVVKLVATGVGCGLPGVAAMEPAGNYLEGLRQRTLNAQFWFTVGADYQPAALLSSRFVQRATDKLVDEFFGAANDLVVPSLGCHLPGVAVADSLRIEGGVVHHCNYFSQPQVHERLTAWLTS